MAPCLYASQSPMYLYAVVLLMSQTLANSDTFNSKTSEAFEFRKFILLFHINPIRLEDDNRPLDPEPELRAAIIEDSVLCDGGLFHGFQIPHDLKGCGWPDVVLFAD